MRHGTTECAGLNRKLNFQRKHLSVCVYVCEYVCVCMFVNVHIKQK